MSQRSSSLVAVFAYRFSDIERLPFDSSSRKFSRDDMPEKRMMGE